MILRPAFLINDLRQGGAERLVKDMAIGMEGCDGIEPIVIIANDHNSELSQEIEDSNVELVILDVAISIESIPIATLALSRELRARNIDLVHSHLPFSHVIGRMVCGLQRTPHVSTYHNVRGHKTVSKRLAEQTTRRLSDRIVCVSDGVRQSYPEMDRMTVIHNAVDVEAFRKRVSVANTSELETKHENETVFLNVARCVEQKRQQDLVETVPLLDREDIHLYIVGDGPYREMLEKLVDERDVSDQVTVTGYVDAIEPYFSIADVFVSSSSNEGLPTTHIEAMAAGLPIVSTEIPGVIELVEHGKNGYLCPVGDPQRLAEGIRFFSSTDPRPFAEYGYHLAKSSFSIKIIIDEHLRLYRGIARSHETQIEEVTLA